MKKKIFFFLMIAIWAFNPRTFLFSQSNDDLYVVTTDYLNVRVEPDINAGVLEVPYLKNTMRKMQLRVTDVVKVLKKSKSEVMVGDKKGRWAYVDTGSYYRNKNEIIKGWVFDYYLAGVKDFLPVKSLRFNMKLEWADGDSGFRYEFYKTGRFIDLTSKNQGTLYIDKTNNVIITKFDREKSFVPLTIIGRYFLNKDGVICVVGGEAPDFITCAKIIK